MRTIGTTLPNFARMKYEILKFLIEHKENTDEGFTDFLRDTFPKCSRKLVRDTLSAMWQDGLMAGPQETLIQVFMPREDLRKPMADFRGNIVGWAITVKGERQYFDDEFRNQTAKVNEAVIKASESTTETNASIKSLNDVIIPRFNSFQQRTSVVTLIVAGLSLVAILFSAYYASTGVTSKDVEALRQQLEKNRSALDSIARQEKGVDSALRKILGDTSRNRLK